MPNSVLNLLEPYLEDSDVTKGLEKGKDVLVSSLQSLALHIAVLKDKGPLRIALGFPTLYELQRFTDYLSDLLADDDVYIFPKDEILRLGTASASKEMEKERLRTLAALSLGKPGIYLFNSVAALELMSPLEEFGKVCFTIHKGDKIDRDQLLERLAKAGYQRVDWVTGAFEFATRGSIVDVFAPQEELPYRFEFDDEKIDDVRLFSPDTEEKTKEIDSALILPASERPLSKEQIEAGKKNLLGELAKLKANGAFPIANVNDKETDINTSLAEIAQTQNVSESDERYFSFFPGAKVTIDDYLGNIDTYLVEPSSYEETQASMKSDERVYFKGLEEKGSALPGETIYAEPNAILLHKRFLKAEVNSVQAEDGISDIPVVNRSMNESYQLFHDEMEGKRKVYAILEKNSIPTFTDYLSSVALGYAIYPDQSHQITIIPGSLTKGFRIGDKASFVSSEEIFGIALRRSRFLTRYKDFQPIKKYSDLKPGDYVVHEDNGIGVYEGMEVMDGLDYLKIKYAKGATLYVPVFQFGKIRKYAGSEAAKPSLDVIGGSTWARRKAKIKSRMSFLADRLLDIYAERASAPGISFPEDRAVEGEFAKRFPYPLTGSQISAWDAISKDMAAPHPMDRLIAGDVGFGKTEVAFKAIFRAIENGYQTALLCPTTVLARQHFEVAFQRFKGFGVKIGLLCRFGSEKEIAETLADIASGKIDLVIGTHRLLSQDVKFKKLGFLAVDEEQRFGVAQKERIKEISKNIDVLSLSATPIPRTLQMSLLTIRPMSTLTEPPSNRLPVKTYVVQENNGLVKEVIARELARHGQVYFLHNRIDTIYRKAGELKKMFPDANIGIAHGKMNPDQLSDVMNDFYDGTINILVCTSIIESGLDIPNVNTIIVEDAQNFGLSALYQIKGRVGRSDRLAYAYLFYRDYDHLTDEGRKRLKAIKEFTELGSGYKIAQRDLAIRGAGNILGKEQAGFIDSLGYESYTQLLTEVIKQKRDQKLGIKEAAKPKTRYLLSFTLDAHIPEDYASEADRINLYREFADCTTDDDLKSLAKKIKDSFGPFPLEVANLFAKRQAEINLEDTKVFASFEEFMEDAKLVLSKEYSDVLDIAKTTEALLKPLDEDIQSVRFTDRQFIILVRRTPEYLSDLLYLTSQLKNAFYGKPIQGKESEKQI